MLRISVRGLTATNSSDESRSLAVSTAGGSNRVGFWPGCLLPLEFCRLGEPTFICARLIVHMSVGENGYFASLTSELMMPTCHLGLGSARLWASSCCLEGFEVSLWSEVNFFLFHMSGRVLFGTEVLLEGTMTSVALLPSSFECGLNLLSLEESMSDRISLTIIAVSFRMSCFEYENHAELEGFASTNRE